MNTTTLATIARRAIVVMAVMIGGAPFLPAAMPPVPGDERRWALDFRTRLEHQGTVRPAEVHLSGEWISTVSAVRQGEYDAALQLVNGRVILPAGATPSGSLDLLQRRLARPFWATYRHDGSLVAVHFYNDTDAGDRNVLQMIAAECQFVQPAGNRPFWTTLERDAAGQYETSYSVESPNVVTKRKLKYVRATAPGKPSDGVRIDIDQSEFRFTLEADGVPATLDAKTRTRLGVASGANGQLAVVTEIHLAGLRRSHVQEQVGSLARALPQLVSTPLLTHQPNPEQLRARMDGQLLEGHTTASLLGANAEDPLTADRLAALFRQRPDAPAAAVTMLRNKGANGRVTDALGTAGSPAAIEALAALARDRSLPRPLRIDALSAFILLQQPSVAAMQAPSALLDDPDAKVAAAARMAGGALARAGRAAQPAQADRIDASLVDRYRRTQDAQQSADLLAAMGNSAGKSVVPAIESALRDDRAAVRAAAARALRLATGPDIDRLLSSTILDDRDAGVRATAIFAVSFRKSIGPKLVDALVHAAKADPADHVRTSAISLLRQHSGDVPNLSETLVWIVRHDPALALRNLAQEAMQGLSATPAR